MKKKMKILTLSLVIRDGMSIVNGICYLNSKQEIKTDGFFICESLERAIESHTVRFGGEHPFDADGNKLGFVKAPIRNVSNKGEPRFLLSRRPNEGNYLNVKIKILFYASELLKEVKKAHPSFSVEKVDLNFNQEPIKYMDDLVSSAEPLDDTYLEYYGLQDVSKKLENLKIGIIGLGGTGSHILDLVIKTPVKEIHIFDGDKLISRNFFRMPGAKKEEYINAPKVKFLKDKYQGMRPGVIKTHEQYVNKDNVESLSDLDFIFISMDRPEEKLEIINFLKGANKSFIDVGMAVSKSFDDPGLAATLKTGIFFPGNYDKLENIHVNPKVGANDYDNAQVIELNSLHASLAVIQWKKRYGFYEGGKSDLFIYYSIPNKIKDQ